MIKWFICFIALIVGATVLYQWDQGRIAERVAISKQAAEEKEAERLLKEKELKIEQDRIAAVEIEQQNNARKQAAQEKFNAQKAQKAEEAAREKLEIQKVAKAREEQRRQEKEVKKKIETVRLDQERRTLEAAQMTECPTCNGGGSIKKDNPASLASLDASGCRNPDIPAKLSFPCPRCNGKGKVDKSTIPAVVTTAPLVPKPVVASTPKTTVGSVSRAQINAIKNSINRIEKFKAILVEMLEHKPEPTSQIVTNKISRHTKVTTISSTQGRNGIKMQKTYDADFEVWYENAWITLEDAYEKIAKESTFHTKSFGKLQPPHIVSGQMRIIWNLASHSRPPKDAIPEMVERLESILENYKAFLSTRESACTEP